MIVILKLLVKSAHFSEKKIQTIRDNLQVSKDRLPMVERVGCGTHCLLGSLGVREVVGSYQETGKVFSPEMPFYSKKFWNTSPWGSVSYRPSVSPSYEASSHVNNYAYSGKLLLTKWQSSTEYYIRRSILWIMHGYLWTLYRGRDYKVVGQVVQCLLWTWSCTYRASQVLPICLAYTGNKDYKCIPANWRFSNTHEICQS